MNKRIKSIEIFPQITGEYDSIEKYPIELLDLVEEYIQEKKITIKVKATHSFMEKIYNVCDKYNIRCQKYIN